MALTPAEEKELEDLKAQVKELYGPTTPELGLEAAGRAMDTIPITRIKAIEAITGRKDLLTPEEERAVYFGETTDPTGHIIQLPNSAELLRRAGFKEGTKISDLPGIGQIYTEPGTMEEGPTNLAKFRPEKGGWLDPSGRGTIGTLLDMATDPLTYAGMLPEKIMAKAAKETIKKQGARAAERGALGVGYGEAAKDFLSALKNPRMWLRPGSEISDYIAQKLYQSGMRPLDETSVKVGKQPFSSEYGLGRGYWGSAAGIQNKILEEQAPLWKKVEAAERQMDILDPVRGGGIYGVQAGGVDMPTAMLPAELKVAGMEDIPSLADIQNTMRSEINKRKGIGRTSYAKAGAEKRAIYKGLPGNAFNLAASVPAGSEVKKAMSYGLKTELEKGAEELAKKYPQFADILGVYPEANKDLGALLTVESPAARMAGKEATKPIISPTTTGALIAGQMENMHPLGAAAKAKTAVDWLRMTGPKTTVGYWGSKMAQNPAMSLADAAMRQKFLDEFVRKNRSEEE